MDLVFKDVDLEHDFSKCFNFRRDSYLCSFDSLNGFESSIHGYKERIKSRIKSSEWFYKHVWLNSEIIGQLEFRSFSDEPNLGYVHLIYLTKQYRGLGIAESLQEYIEIILSEKGCTGALLSVSCNNLRALRHYKKNGWVYYRKNKKHELTDFYLKQFKS